jgi:hypothetical protein
MKLITKENLSEILNIAKSAGTTLSDQAVDVVNQALNYALFEGFLSLLGTLSIYLIYYFIARLLKASEDANNLDGSVEGKKVVNMIKTWRNLLFIVFTAITTYLSVGSIKLIGKIMISPKLYLLEEGIKIIERIK